jgi:hypothetical protein
MTNDEVSSDNELLEGKETYHDICPSHDIRRRGSK